MQRNKLPLPRGAKLLSVVCVLMTTQTVPAFAHVKWFAPYQIAEQPTHLKDVLSPLFVELALLSVLVLWCVSAIETTRPGSLVAQAVDTVFANLRERSDALVRGGTAMFFVAVFVAGGIILTPELKTTVAATSWLQAAIAIGTFWQSTMVLSGLGIIMLFAQGIWSYGLFHMMDYPIFFGAAVYLIMRGLRWDTLLGLAPRDVVRWGAAVTLMWASVEKWAYPDWSYPLLHAHTDITMGLDPRFYMVAAGIVEFSLSFALLWTPLVRRIAAIVLMSMFVSAVFEFGKIDAIGHLLIIVLLLVIAADDQPSRRLKPIMAPVWYSLALGMTILAYYVAHALLYGTAVV